MTKTTRRHFISHQSIQDKRNVRKISADFYKSLIATKITEKKEPSSEFSVDSMAGLGTFNFVLIFYKYSSHTPCIEFKYIHSLFKNTILGDRL